MNAIVRLPVEQGRLKLTIPEKAKALNSSTLLYLKRMEKKGLYRKKMM